MLRRWAPALLVVAEGWEVLAVAVCLMTSVQLWRGVIRSSVAKVAPSGHSGSAVGDVAVSWRWCRGLGRRDVTTCSHRGRGRSLAWDDGSCPRPARRCCGEA